MQSPLSFLSGVVRWSREHPGMEFLGRANGRTVRFVITAPALAALSGTPSLGPEDDFDTFFDHEADVQRAAAAVFRDAGTGPDHLIVTQHDLAATMPAQVDDPSRRPLGRRLASKDDARSCLRDARVNRIPT